MKTPTLFDLTAYTVAPPPKVLFDENGVEETELDRYRRRSQKSPLQKIQGQIEKLAPEQQRLLSDWLSDRLSILERAAKSKSKIVERKLVGDICYQLEKIKCGKARCKKCQSEGHGPYWYSYQRVNGRVRSKYLGKNGPES